jgi:alkanesulfonate monooxygenase SsuD/methylene tetrahydromethanopterin reductase-like flavin-dependent oxidoreductase (luciferase family)
VGPLSRPRFTGMKFSVWPSFARPFDELLTFVKHIEDTGWYGLWYADHYMPDLPDGAVSDGPAFEAWSIISALSVATSRLRLGTLVSPTTVHHPALLAKRAATIDQMSNGRFILGIGAGWQVNEHRAYGIELFGAKDRVDRFEEAIQIVQSMLRNPRTTMAGTHFNFADAPCEPKPVQTPLPVLVGTGGPRMSRITAQHADEWNVWGNPERVRGAIAVIDAACEKVGRDPATLRRTAQGLFFLVDSDEKAAKLRASAPADRSLIGSSAQLVDIMNEFAAMGIDEFIVPDFTLGRDATERIDTYDRLRVEVLAHVS